MEQLDLATLISIFQEMLGGWLWLMVAVIIFGTFSFIALLVLERGVASKRMIGSQIVGVFGGAVALIIMAKVSSSGFTDAGGPADWLLIALVYGLGFIGATIVLYTLAGWFVTLKKSH